MSYTKQTWQNGDIITAEKLNHMEDGISEGGGGALVVHIDEETGALDKTWAEINAAAPMVWLYDEYQAAWMSLIVCFGGDGEYGCAFAKYTGQFVAYPFYTDSENGYPVDSGGPGPK